MVKVTFMNVHFLWVLFSIPIMIALHFFLMKFAKRRAVLFANFEALKRVTGGITFSKNITILIARLLIILFVTLSAAGLTLWLAGPGSEFNYVVAIDSSSSMLANDFYPTRLDVAKEGSKTFVDDLNANVKIGVVSFAGVPKTVSPVTDDRSQVLDALDSIKVSGVGGTDISSALFTGVNLLLNDADRSMAVILVTDGRHTVGSPVEEGTNYAVENMVTVHTVGLATDAGGSFEMTSLLSTIDEESLTRIARSTGGQFHRAGSLEQLIEAFGAIVEVTEQDTPYQLRLPFLIVALILLLGEWVLSNTSFRILP